MSTADLFLYAWLASALVMGVLWAIQLRTENAGIVDVAWSFMTPVVGCWLILFDNITDSARQYLICALGLLWGFRLGSHLYTRVMNETEDSRYRFMRQSSGRHAGVVMFVFFQLQATWVLLFAIPFWAAAQNISPDISITDIIGIMIWVFSILGELLSDKQLASFRNNPANKGKVCQHGLWRYSRHPNYFFEWLHWLAYAFIGFYSGYWWMTLAGAAIMYIFITRITGIPYTEKQALRSRGGAYEKYQASTSAFFPLPRNVHYR